jgi:hypothetical protein
MHRPILTFVFIALVSGALMAQQPNASDPYSGQSHPPSDDTIVTPPPAPQIPKPPAGQRLTAPSTQAPEHPAQPAPPAHPTSVDPPINFPDPDVTGSDDGIVRVDPQSSYQVPGNRQPGLYDRQDAYDPDGDIVHPHPLQPGELEEGATIRVRLLTRLSTADTERGEEFRTRVATDVIQNGQVLIPAGAEIDGRVVTVSRGTAGGRGSMRLRPDTVILLDGSRYRLDALVTGTPGSRTRVNHEGTINAGSRAKKDGIEYGGAVGAGAVTGAFLGGPVGALTGGLIGAGAITVHLLVDHPQATLEPGTVLLFTLNDRLNLQIASNPGN